MDIFSRAQIVLPIKRLLRLPFSLPAVARARDVPGVPLQLGASDLVLQSVPVPA